MTDESWARAVELFHSALDRDARDRDAFLREACGDDDALYESVRSLVRADEASHDAGLEDIAAEAAADLVAEPSPAGRVGQQIGRYRVVEHLGSGGMGDVYRAIDPVLGRDVALKLLASRFQADDSFRRRLGKEARAASALNHPNIVTIFEVGRAGAHEFVASELVDGVTLRTVIARGPVPVHDLARIGGEIAAGLVAAHAAGIIHRDIKPENVMIRQDNLVKIVDFGLAKGSICTSRESTGAWLPSIATGSVAGTACYMSPEQALGEPLDHRTDLFSLGIVLYEMATGIRPFDGPSDAALYDALLHKPPAPPSALRPELPPALDGLIGRALEKDRELRYQTAADLGSDLKRLQRPQAPSLAWEPRGRVGTRRRTITRLAWVATAALGIALGFAIRPAPVGLLAARFTIAPPPNAEFTLTGTIVPSVTVSVSPDGRMVVFLANRPNEPGRLWVRSLDSTEAVPLDDTTGAEFPFWSPDSRSVAFFADRVLKVKQLAGGAARTIAETASARGATWNRDGVIVFGTAEGPIYRVPSAGGTPVRVTALDAARGESWHRFPEFLPDGRHFLYLARAGEDRALYVGSLDGQVATRVLETDVHASYAAPGYILFVQHGALLARAFDAGTLRFSGEPIALAPSVATSTALDASFAVSPAGVLVYAARASAGGQPTWFDRSGRTIQAAIAEDECISVRLSPDDTIVAVTRSTPTENAPDIWLHDLGRGAAARFTFNQWLDISPVWSPDGGTVVFASSRTGRFSLFRRAAAGGPDAAPFFTTEASIYPNDWSPDGRYIVYSTDPPAKSWDLGLLDVATMHALPLVNTPYDEYQGQISPDGRWLAFTSEQTGRPEVYVRPFPAGAADVLVSTSGGSEPFWRRDGGELFYLAADGTMMSVPLAAGARFVPHRPRPLFRTRVPGNRLRNGFSYAATADGQRFLVTTTIAGDAPAQALVVMLDWRAGTRR